MASTHKKLILAIETSCDETALALVEASGGLTRPKFKVLKNLVSSQVKIHAPYGGVVPNLAKREHLKNLPILYRQVFSKEQRANRLWNKIDLIAVTVGPGLEPALWTGIAFAQELAIELAQEQKISVVGANHLEGHLYSFLLPQKTVRSSKFGVRSESNIEHQTSNIFPAISLIVSGGHTILLKMDSLAKWEKLGETRDDAVGEAFDKVARMLGLPYPGGPALEKLALGGNPAAISFPRPMLHDKSYDFSFSGLKTAVLYFLRNQTLKTISYKLKADIAASFQEAAIDVLVRKTMRAAKEFKAKSIMLSGGVAANKALRKILRLAAKKSGTQFLVPDTRYNTDNAAMIAVAGYMALLRQSFGGQAYPRKKKFKLEAQGDLSV